MKEKNAAAVALGRKGGIARAKARWDNPLKRKNLPLDKPEKASQHENATRRCGLEVIIEKTFSL